MADDTLMLDQSSIGETFEKCSILFKVKEGENLNHRNIPLVFRGLRFESDAEIGQKRAFFKGLLEIIDTHSQIPYTPPQKTCQSVLPFYPPC
jgi:hypothetical protein